MSDPTDAVERIALDYKLPCAVKLPPATTIGKGCTLETLLVALKIREGRDLSFAALPSRAEIERQARERAIRDVADWIWRHAVPFDEAEKLRIGILALIPQEPQS